MREFSKLAALAGGIAFAAGLAYAADQTILGKSLTVKNPTGDNAQRFIKGSGKEKGSSGTLTGDPTLSGTAGGAFLDIFANGTHPSQQRFPLPQGTSSTGKPFWTKAGSPAIAFKYKDAKGDQGPVKSLIIKKTANGLFSIKAKLTGKNGTIDVKPPDSGTDGCLALKIGMGSVATGDRYSVQFGPESKIKNADGKVFSAKKPKNEGVCPTVTPTTTTTTTTTGATTTTTSTSTTTTHASTTSTTSTTLPYGSPSRAFLEKVESLLD